MAENNSTTKEPKADYPGPLADIKKQLEDLERLEAFLRYLADDLATDGEITPRAEMLIDLAGKVDMAVDSIHYRLNPKFEDDRKAAEAGE